MNIEHEKYMRIALQQAEIAFQQGEIPIGCVIVSTVSKNIIAKAFNQVEKLQDPTAHAEIIAITAACQYIGSKYLHECTLYVTLEPCLMCSGAIFWAQIPNIIYGASDTKYGITQYAQELLKKRVNVQGGILEKDCKALIQEFFKQKRK